MPIDPFQFENPPDYTPCSDQGDAAVSDALVVLQEQLDDLFDLVDAIAAKLGVALSAADASST